MAQESLAAEGFDHFYNLEYDQAIADFEQAIAQNPIRPTCITTWRKALVFREMYRDGALESELVSGNNSFLRRPKLNPAPETEKRFLDEIGKAMALSRSAPREEPQRYRRHVRAGHLLRAALELLLGGEEGLARFAQGRHRRAAPAQSHQRTGTQQRGRAAGARAWTTTSWAACRGDGACWGSWWASTAIGRRALRTVQDVARNGKLDRIDAEIFLGALYRRENQPRQAIPLVEDLIRRFPRNFLLRLELSQMYSMAGDKTHALEAAEDVAQLKTRHAPGYDRVPWEKIYFQEGTIEFWYNDLDHALENMKKVAAASEEVDLNTGVSAYLRMGQIYDMTHRRGGGSGSIQEGHCVRPPGGSRPGVQEVPLDPVPPDVAARRRRTRSIRVDGQLDGLLDVLGILSRWSGS